MPVPANIFETGGNENLPTIDFTFKSDDSPNKLLEIKKRRSALKPTQPKATSGVGHELVKVDNRDARSPEEILRAREIEAVKWPREIMSHAKRKHFICDYDFSKTIFADAKFPPDSEIHCFVCNRIDGDLLNCRGMFSGIVNKKKTRCRTKFHLNCLMKYNASDYNAQYIVQAECQNELLCPLHFCDICYLDRRKQSAFSGYLVECAFCMRAFHQKDCSPMGCKDLEVRLQLEDGVKYLTEMIVCPSHRQKTRVTQHLTVCCDCEIEDKKEELSKCKSCVRSFHPKCRTVKSVNNRPVAIDVCEFCLTGECVRLRTPIMVRWRAKEFYPGRAREWHSTPIRLRKHKYYDIVGYCLVEWLIDGKLSQFSIASIADCVPMFEKSLKLYGKNQSENQLNAWRALLDDEMLTPPRVFPVLKEVKRKLDTARYFSKDCEKAICEPEVNMCNCAENDENRCSTEDCANVRTFFECPPGEFIVEYAGEIINKQELERRSAMIGNARDNEANLYINHSCRPNCTPIKKLILLKLRNDGAYYDHRIAIVAIEDIEKDEELTFSYQMENMLNSAIPECKCGVENCSGFLSKSSINDDSKKSMKRKASLELKRPAAKKSKH
ncbi:unnamed protein product [Caenorhabditis bovis]|uniref:SET domain-containing protein n=1 Tax=Caenorhabditis bovis TaxID=2654633 RepID=A0A8S1ENB2_9PELO|nr:unnamed protein product [Caenorhabditis bovis]